MQKSFFNTLSFAGHHRSWINTCFLLFLWICRWASDVERRHWSFGVVEWLKVTKMWELITWQPLGAMEWLSVPWSANVHRSSKCQIWCEYSTVTFIWNSLKRQSHSHCIIAEVINSVAFSFSRRETMSCCNVSFWALCVSPSQKTDRHLK